MDMTTDDATPNVRASGYFIVESRFPCLKCSQVSAVFAFAVPKGYESLCVDDSTPENECGVWEPQELAAVLSFVGCLPEAVIKRVRAVTSCYRIVTERETCSGFWMNHCEHCGARMEEEELHEDMDGPFGSIPSVGWEAIRLHEVREPFAAAAGGESHHLRPLNG
jgi:hypothetical protein